MMTATQGVITTDDGMDLTVYAKSCTDGKTLQKGDKVQFDLEDSPTNPGEFFAGNVSGGSGSPGGKGGGWGAGASAGGAWGATGGTWAAAPAAAQWGGGGKGWGGAASGAAGTGQYTGTVKSFQPDKGFGFVAGSDGTDYFFHQKQIVDGSSPVVGDTLQHDLQPSPIKPGQFQCSNITGGSGAGKGGGQDMSKGKGGGKDMGKGKGKEGGERMLKGKKHQLCTHFPLGTCRRMENCTFAHSEAEIGTSYDFSGGAASYGAAPTGAGNGAAGPYAAWGGASAGW